MPTAPEFCDTAGNIGIVEILQIPQAQHITHTDGHIGICGKVQIDLQAVGNHAQPCLRNRQRRQMIDILRQKRRICHGRSGQKNGVSQNTAGICQQNLLRKARRKTGYTLCHLRLSGLVREQVLFNGLIADNRAGNALMKQRRIQQYIPIPFLCPRLSPVHIHHICQQLEGVKGNTNGQCNALDGIRHGAEYGADQPCVLEVADERDINHAGQRQPQFPFLRRALLHL